MGQMTKRRVRALKSVLLACAATAAPTFCLGLTPAIAQSQAQPRYEFDLPAQPLARSVAAVAARAEIQVLYTEDAPNEVRAPALRGRMTADQALARLTAGTGFTYVYTQPGVIRLERVRTTSVEDDGSRVLGPVRVEGAQSTFAYSGAPTRGDGLAQPGGLRGRQDEEAIGYRPVVAAIASGMPTAIEDIPRSISVLTQEQIEKQDIQDIGDAIERLPGVTLIESQASDLSSGAAILSRGFAITRAQVDGGASRPLNIVANGMLDLGAYERVELVRGPNGVFSGSSSPGGSLNLVRKRPGDVESYELTGTVGSFDRRGAQLDYSTPSLAGTAFAFRGVASLSDQNFFYERGAKRNALLYGVIDAPMGERARLEVGLQHSRIEEDSPYSGKYRYVEGSIIDFGGFYYNITPTWAFDNTTNTQAFGRLYVDVNDTIDLSAGVDFETGAQLRRGFYSNFAFRETGQSLFSYLGGQEHEYETDTISFDIKVNGKSRILGLDHNWLVSGELTESSAATSRYGFSYETFFLNNVSQVRPTIDGWDPVFAPVDSAFDPLGTASRSALVIADVISWRDIVDLTLSVRRYYSEASTVAVTREITDIIDIGLGEAQQGDARAKPEWAPTWAIAFKPTRNLTFYGTRAEGTEEIVTPRYTADGEILPPSTYENLEGGAKFATDRWLASLSYYDLKQENVPEAMPGTVCPPTNSTSSPCYFNGGGARRTRGVDFEFAGELFTGLSVAASYNWARIESRNPSVTPAEQSPTNAAQIFVDWSPLFMPGTSFRGGARYRGEVFQSGSQQIYDPVTGAFVGTVPYNFTEDPYLVFDLGVRHQLTDEISLDVFAENVTNEEYLSTVTHGVGNFPGAPRTIVATLRWKASDWPGSRQSTTGMAPFGDAADWYAAIETGVHGLGDLEAHAEGVAQDGVTPIDWTFESESRAIAGVRVGYRFAPRLRAEVEGSFRSSRFTDIGGGAAAPFGVCSASYADIGVPFDCDSANGEADNWSLMANGLYDFGAETARIRPFIGGGLGVARHSIDFSGKMEGIGSDDPWNYNPDRHLQEAIGGDSTRLAFAWQLLAGLSFRVNDQASIDATYRYYRSPEASWGSYNLEGEGGYASYGFPTPALTTRVGDFEADYVDQSLMIGLRWAFGVR